MKGENFEPIRKGAKHGNGSPVAANKGRVKRRLKGDRHLGKKRRRR